MLEVIVKTEKNARLLLNEFDKLMIIDKILFETERRTLSATEPWWSFSLSITPSCSRSNCPVLPTPA